VALAALLLVSAAAAQQQQQQAQPPAKPSFHADHYEVDATLSPGNQTLLAKAQVEFVAGEPSRTLQVELNEDLNIKSVQLDGKPVQFMRVAGNPLDVSISLPQLVPAGQKVTLAFEYSGPLSSAEDSPSKGVRLAYIGSDRAYFLLSARWFPLTSDVGQRYTGVFHFTVPQNLVVVGSGTSGAPDTVAMPQGVKPAEKPAAGATPPQWLRYTFTVDKPAAVGTFVAGGFELTPVTQGGFSYSVYTPPKDKNTAEAYAQQVSRIVDFYSTEFGPLKNRSLTLAQLPNVAPMNGASAPGLLLVTQRNWSKKPPDSLLARLMAHQWWNDLVMPATPSDVWLSDGLSRYSEVLYAQHAHGEGGLHSAVENCAVGALMDESVAPIGQAWRLQPYTTAYQSIVRDKGAMVFHMLRTAIGDNAFASVLHEYVQQYSGKSATIRDFEQLVRAKLSSLPAPSGPAGAQAPRLNAIAFFSQWLNSTGVPDFHLDYTVYRTEKGFKVVGKIKQNLTTLNMPIEIEVKTEGNPVTKTVQVVGDSSEFSVDTFGEPKANGIILDPHNNMLKSTPDLRVRAMIAQGEALAERGKFFKAVQQYQKALGIQRHNGLALFRMGEAMFYEQNYQAAANSFRDAVDAQVQPENKWVIVWAHIYLGKIYDLIGQRARAMNEYQKALDTKDDTSGALEQARKYMKVPYTAEPAPGKSSN
jgi:aminopeptidase N